MDKFGSQSVTDAASSGSGAGGELSIDALNLLNALPVPIGAHDAADGSTRFINAAFVETFGYTMDDLPSLLAWAERAYPDPDYRQASIATWQSDIETRRTTGKAAPPREYRIIDKAGRERHVLIGFALHGGLVVVTFQDLTGKRAAEAALEAERREHEKAAFALTENMPAGAYTMVLRPGAELAQFAFVSTQFLHMLELTREEAVGDPMTVFSRVHPEDRPNWLKINAEAFAERRPFSGEARIVAHGQTRWIRAESVPRELDDGSVIWEGILVDITRLKETEHRLAAVLRAANAFTWTRDLKSQRSIFDRRWAEVVGPGPHAESLTNQSWINAVHPDDAVATSTAVARIEAGASDHEVLTYRRRIGDDRWIWLRVHAGVSDRDGEGRPTALSGVSFDITAEVNERLRAQEEQSQLREDLQRAQQRDTVAQVAGGVAHSLNNLIAVVAGTADLLEMRADGQEWLRDGLDRIRRSVEMAQDLTGGLGGLVRPEIPRGTHDLCKLLADGIELLGRRRIARHAIRLRLPQGTLPVWANPTEIAQVIVNLAINACEAGTAERIAQVTLTACPAGTAPPQRPPDLGVAPVPGLAMSLFTVADTGAGITDAVRARMFRPNFSTKGESASGLGLLIVSGILLGSRAAMWVDSTPGAGTTVTVAWPAVPPADAEAPPAGPDLRQPAVSGPVLPDVLDGIHALVVDDLPDVAEVLAGMLETAGAIAFAESDPDEAGQILAEAPEVWSVLVCDLHMPGMDGRALARLAGRLNPPVPVVLVTARPETLGDGPNDEFAVVLSKPVSAAQLAQAVFDAARTRRGRTA